MTNPTAQSVLFPKVLGKPTRATFDGEALSSDGGAALLATIDRGLGLTEDLATLLEDPRDPDRVRHSVLDLLRQRVVSIAMGYADQNDAARVASDPMIKSASGRAPVRGDDLASQPTLSRFENSVTAPELVAMARRLEETVVERLRRRHARARRVTIDLDPSCDPTHGAQQQALFNGFYGSWCYLPVFGFVTVDGDPEQYVFCARLRPGNSREGRTSLRTIRRMVGRLRAAFPKTEILVRLDSGFATPRLFDMLDELGVKYVVGMPKNPRLVKMCEAQMTEAAELAETEQATAQLYGEVEYRTRAWSRSRRVVFKAEVLVAEGKLNKENPRFVVHNLSRSYKSETVYKRIYCGRGDSENRIKELKHGLDVDRTSDSRFLANQFRVLLSTVAFVLFQELRYQLRDTEAAAWQVRTIRERLLKIGVRVVESVRRVVMHLAAACPWRSLWCEAARRLGAVPG
ncbi:IS1380 family transposase [bacterium]|nr:IS1380 family transposase [bacterium]